MALHPELETAIDDIVNEVICEDDDGKMINIVMDDLKDKKISQDTKNKIEKEFETVLRLLDYGNNAHDIFRRWYIDGRLFFHIIIDKNNPQSGIQELRYIDPRRIKKIRELKKQKDGSTGAEIVTVANEYYIYHEATTPVGGSYSSSIPGVKLTTDSIINVNSGLMDARRSTVLSYLHKAIKPLNQLRMMEDATVIYRISRAPERRIFYIDVGNLPKTKAEQYMNDIMAKYKNKLVYDIATGQVRDDRKHLSMLEDFWLPRREGGKGTEIETLSGGENLGVMEDVVYFEKKLYKALGVPVTRLDPQNNFTLGRSIEISRDELKFQKFVERLRLKFSELFDDIMRTQLALKGIATPEEWDYIKEYVYFDFIKDNYFTELKEAEVMRERLTLLQSIDPYKGIYYSKNWIQQHVLRLNDEEIDDMDKEIEEEMEEQNEMNDPSMGGDPSQQSAPGQEGNGGDGPPEQQSKPDPQDKDLNDKVRSLK